MHATLPLIALATGAALPSSLRAAGRARKNNVTVVLPARLQEDVRVVGALAELFATTAAERLMNAGLTSGSDEPIDPPPSNQPRRIVGSEVLPLIALAVGAALCTPMLTRKPIAKGDRARREKKGDA